MRSSPPATTGPAAPPASPTLPSAAATGPPQCLPVAGPATPPARHAAGSTTPLAPSHRACPPAAGAPRRSATSKQTERGRGRRQERSRWSWEEIKTHVGPATGILCFSCRLGRSNRSWVPEPPITRRNSFGAH